MTCHYFFVNQEIMDVEHLWFSSSRAAAAGSAGAGARAPDANANETTAAAAAVAAASSSAAEGEDGDNNNPQNLTVMADKRLYKLVKWCKSLPLFKNILVSVDWQGKGRLFLFLPGVHSCLSLCVRRRKSHTFSHLPYLRAYTVIDGGPFFWEWPHKISHLSSPTCLSH